MSRKERNLAQIQAPGAEGLDEAGDGRSEQGGGRSALHPPWGSRRQLPGFPILSSAWVKLSAPAALTQLFSDGRELGSRVGVGGLREGGKNRHGITWASFFTHKRKVLSVSFQLSKDFQQASGVRPGTPPRASSSTESTHQAAAARRDAGPRPGALRRPGAQQCRWVPGPARPALLALSALTSQGPPCSEYSPNREAVRLCRYLGPFGSKRTDGYPNFAASSDHQLRAS